jgi:hypothetical protein
MKGRFVMIKKLALLAAVGILYVAAPAAPAAAQGISVQLGNGGYHQRDRGYHRGHGYRDSRVYERRDRGPRHHGWDRRGSRTKTVIIR